MAKAPWQTIPWARVVAFADRLGAGNPAVVLRFREGESRWLDAEWMQAFAREVDAPATAYLYPAPRTSRQAVAGDPDSGAAVKAAGDSHGDPERTMAGEWLVRWFAPVGAIGLCGHGALASFAWLATTTHLEAREAASRPGSETSAALRLVPGAYPAIDGVVTADAHRAQVEMSMPSLPFVPQAEEPATLRQALGGAQPVALGMVDGKLLVELADEVAVRELRYDFAAGLAANPWPIIVTARALEPTAGGYDFVSRVFYHREDPVTGSAHAGLAPYWANKLGKPQLIGRQVSSRGGTIDMTVQAHAVTLRGRARVVAHGYLG